MRISRVEQLEVRTMLSVDFVHVAESLDEQLVTMQDRVTQALSFFQTGETSQIPIVGDQLGQAVDFVDSFREKLRDAIEVFGTSVPTDLQLQTSLADQLTPFLGASGMAGVHISRAGDVATVEMVLQGSTVVDDVDIGFSTGLPSLPFQVTADGSIEISVGFAVEVAFTINVTNGVVALVNGSRNLTGVSAPDDAHPLLDANSDLALFVSAGPSADFNAKAVIGFVQGTVAPIPGLPNGLYATALVSNLLTTPSIKLDGRADANLRLAGSFAGSVDDFPGISTDFHFRWGLSSADPNFGAPEVSFDNVSLTFGTFLSNVLRPTLDPIKDALDPISPVLSFLAKEVPGISDLSEAAGAGPIRILDLAVLGSNLTGNGPLGELAGKITDLLTKIDSIQLGSNISLPLGGFDLNSTTNGDLRKAVIAGDFKDLSLANLSPLAAANLNNIAVSASQSLHDLIDDLPISDDLKNELHGLNALSTPNGFQIGFPILNDPAGVVFNMLLGRDSDLFYFKADADVQLKGSRASGLSFFGAGIDLVGQADIETHLKFGYDTYGLRQLLNNLTGGGISNIISDITDGFYISDDSYFKMAGSITAEWGSTVLNAFPVRISGGLYTQEHGTVPVHVYIEDPNDDGKLRIGEFFRGNGHPTAFRTTGQLLAGIHAEVGYPDPDDDGPLLAPPHDVLEIAETTLIDFGMPTPLALASEPDANGKITLYLGTNAHLRAGGAQDTGDETFVIQHLSSNPDGSENIRVRAFGLIQDIDNVRSIQATDQVGNLAIFAGDKVTSSVDITGGQGAAHLTYLGTGTAKLTGGALASTLQGGSGPSILTGGPGNDTIYLGTGSNIVNAGGGENTVIVRTSITQNATISGGTTGHNHLRIDATSKTTRITADPVGNAIQLGITRGAQTPTPVKLTFSNVDDVYFQGSFSPTSFLVGDLAAAGVQLLTLDIQTPFKSNRHISIDTRFGLLPSDIGIHDYLYQYQMPFGPLVERHGAVIENATTGLTTRLLGFHSKDSLNLQLHGGSVTVDALPFTGGNFTFNLIRAANTPESIDITTPSLPDGRLSVKPVFFAWQIEVQGSSSYTFVGSRDTDDVDLFVGAASAGANTIDINAGSVQGEFNVAMLGDTTAVNHVTLRDASVRADVSILGQNTTTDLLLGVGKLAAIRHDVYASDVQLSVDNDESKLASILTLDAHSFGTWNIKTLSGVTPQLTFDNLRGQMTVYAGPGDNFQLDVTPPSIIGLMMYNQSLTKQDLVYTSNWSVPLDMVGNFSFYAGRVLHRNGTVERIKRTALVNSVVNLVFSGNDPSEVIFDADLDAPGALYNITGGERPGFNRVANTTVGLIVTAFDYSQPDRFYIYATGATIDANLRYGPAAQFYFDGQARLGPAGIHPTEPNDITIQARYGSATMTPLAQFNSLLDMFNDVYILGAMPQDSLTVNMPTNVIMTSTLATVLNLELNPNAGAVFDGNTNALISWLEDRPKDGQTGAQQVFRNVLPANWDAFFAPGAGHGDAPNPFAQQPYGIVIPFDEGDASVIYYDYRLINGVRTRFEEEYKGRARFWTVDANPFAVNNDVQLNASQLRGDLNWNVAAPDYDYVRRLQEQTFTGFGVTQSVSYAAPFHTWGTPSSFMRVAFGQSDIVLSHTNPELAVDIDGGTLPFDYRTSTSSSMHNTVVTPYPVVRLNVGDGELANLRGEVTAEQVQLEVDDRSGTQENIIKLTPNDISWFDSDHNRKTLAVSELRSGLTLTGSAVDRFAIEGTPDLIEDDVIERGPTRDTLILDVPEVVTIRNFAPAERHFVSPGVYVMAHRGKQVLDVVGNLGLYMGRRLLTDGTVQNVGDLSGVTTFERNSSSHIVSSYTVNYTYTGLGQGTLVYDGSNFSAPGPGVAFNEYPVSIMSAGVPNRAALRWAYDTSSQELFFPSESVNSLTFGDNTNLTVYSPINGFGARSLGRTGLLVDNPTSAAVQYFANPQTPANRNDTVYVYASGGPLNVTGRGSPTRVIVQPLFENSQPNGDLRSLIAGDLFVTNAALAITPTNPLTPASTPQNVVLNETQLTGLTGGVVSFSNLVDYTILNFNPIPGVPGLTIGMPHYGATSLTVNGTPLGVVTAINTVKDVPIGPTVITATGGELWLGLIPPGVNSNSDPRLRFQTSSIVIGDGDLGAIQGSIRLSPGNDLTDMAPGGVTIDNRLGAAVADAEFRRFSGTFFNDPRDNSIELAGFAPASIFWKSYLTSALDILGSANSHYTISNAMSSDAPESMRLFAGQGSTVDIYRPNTESTPYVGGFAILGAESVRFNKPPSVNANHPVHVLPDPARPNEITEVTFDSTRRRDVFYLDSPLPGQGRIGNGPFAQVSQFNLSFVIYDANHTHLTFLGFTVIPIEGLEPIRVDATPALTTEIVPGYMPVLVSATTNPLDIHLTSGSQLTLGFTGFTSPGDMRPLLGNVSISVDANVNNPAAIRFNNSADPTPRSVSVNPVSANESTVTGMIPAPVSITGNAWTLALNGGSGNNTIVGPNVPSSWLIDGDNAGKLNQKVSFTGMRNVVSGSQDDAILFKTGGKLAGNLDGGPGTDTLRYQNGMLTGADVIDLPNRIAPRVTGQALNLETSGTFTPLAVTNPGEQQRPTGGQIVPLAINVTGGLGTKQFVATGLPDGISIDSQTGILTGIPQTGGQTTQIIVTVTDDSGSASVSFVWRNLAGLNIIQIPNQTANVNAPVSLQVQVQYTYGGTLTYSATDLPPGLSIDSVTGLITGAVTDGAQRPQSYASTIRVTDGPHSAEQVVFWDVVKNVAIVNPGTQVSPELLPVQLAIQVSNATGPVTFSATGLPLGVSIDAQTGVITGRFSRSVGEHATYNVTVNANTSQGQRSTSFTWNTIPGFTPFGVEDRTSQVGQEIYATIYPTNAGFSVVTSTIAGLPPGLSYDGTTVTGTLDLDADTGSPYHVVVTFTNHTENYEYQGTFEWTVNAGIVLGSPGPQSFEVGDIVDITIPVLRDFGNPLEFSADGLPLGLAINPQTGRITGTVQSFPFGQTFTRVTVNATETSGGSANAFVTFDWFVNSVPFILLSSTTIPENSPNGTVVGTLSLAEPGYVGDFSLINDGEGRFSISPDGTQIIVADSSRLDFETNQTHSIYIVFRYSEDGKFVRELDITVTDVDEVGGGFTLNPADVFENSPGGTVVGELIPNNAPGGETFTFTLTDNAGGRFALNGSQVVVANGAVLDYELNTSHIITVEIEDSTGNTQLQSFAITVRNVNEGVAAFTLSPATVPENSPSRTVVGELIPDAVREGVTFTLSMTDNAGGRFSLSGSQVIVASSGLLNYELNSSHVITVRIEDSAGNIELQDFTISVTDVNEENAARFVKNRGPVSLVPEARLTNVGQALAGGTLKISITDVAIGKKQKRFDVMQAASLKQIGTVSETQYANGMAVISVQLAAGISAAQIQAALNAVKFETAGKGLKTPTRDVRVEAKSVAGEVSEVYSEQMQVLKKQPRQRARNRAAEQ